jgi:hypothetical protein
MKKPQELLVKTGEFIGKNKMPLIYIGGAIAVLVVAYPLLSKIVKGIKGTPNIANKNILGGLTVDMSKVTISEQTAKQYAEQLLMAFSSSSGTDTGTIKEIFKRINTEDFKMVAIAFGLRTYDELNTGSPSGALWGLSDGILGKTDMDLVAWLNKELDILDWSTKSVIRKVIEPAGFVLD